MINSKKRKRSRLILLVRASGFIKKYNNLFKRYICDTITRINERTILRRNSIYKDVSHGKRCFIIGNGSSIKSMDLSVLREEFTIVVNNFIAHDKLKEINPHFYVSMEPISLLQKLQRKNYYHPDNYYHLIDKKLKSLRTKLFFNLDTSKYISMTGLFLNKDINYITTHASTLRTETGELISDITRPITFGDGVISTAVCIANYMGFKKIYLLGCDEDAHIHKMVRHFYDYPRPPKLYGSTNEVVAEHKNDIKRWKIIKSYFSKNNVRIYNAGIGGYLEVFPRVKFNMLFHNH